MSQTERVFTYYWLKKVETDTFRRLERALGVLWYKSDMEKSETGEERSGPPNRLYVPLAMGLSKDFYGYLEAAFGLTPQQPGATNAAPQSQSPGTDYSKLKWSTAGGKSDTGSLIAQGEYLPKAGEKVVTLDERFSRDEFKHAFLMGWLPGDEVPEVPVRTINVEQATVELPSELADFFKS